MSPKQAEIIEALQVKPTIDVQAEIKNSINFLKQYLLTTGLKGFVLGISGGQDSLLAGKLAQMAMTELREETGNQDYQFIAMRLPYGNQSDESDAMAGIDYMHPDRVIRVNIKAAVDATVSAVEENQIIVSDFNRGNIKARQRMIAQYSVAGEFKAAVIGTDHAAEAVTGFYTKFGDGGADVTPLWRLNKRQGKALLTELNAPKALYEKIPTADLEDDRPALPDEVALGVSYNNIDDYLEGREVPTESAKIIENWYVKTEHKRHLPITVKDQWWK